MNKNNGFNMELANEDMSMRLLALNETIKNPELEFHFDVKFTNNVFGKHFVICAENDEDARIRFLLFAKNHNIDFGAIKSITILKE